MDDSIAEGPHAVAKKVLADNIRDLRELAPELGMDIDVLWRSWKALVQTKAGRRGTRNKRMTAMKFKGMVYRMSHCSEAPALADCGGGEMEDSETEIAGDGADASGSVIFEARPRGSDDATAHGRHLDSWRHDVDSHVGGGRCPRPFVCTILVKHTRNTHVKTWTNPSDPPELYTVSVQPLERWRPDAWPLDVLGATMECFESGDPCCAHLLKLSGVGHQVRQHMFRWSCRQSDVDGCICLYDRQPLRPVFDLGDSHAPTLCILDALAERGWAGQSRLARHEAGRAQVFDDRGVVGRRAYLQAV